MENHGEIIVRTIRNRLKLCNLTKIFLAVDFDTKHGHGSQSMHNKGPGLQRKKLIYDRILAEFDVVVLDAAEDYPRVHQVRHVCLI